MKQILPLTLLLVLVLVAVGCATQTVTTTSATTSTTTSPSSTAASVASTVGPSSTTTSSSTTTTLPPFEAAATFTAELTGTEVVPPVETSATGTATFSIDASGTRAYFKLTLSNVTDVIASRVHEGKPGSNGSGLLILYPGPTVEGPFNGVIAQGYFNASALIGSLTGKTIADFAVLLQGGLAYVNVGTVQNPEGEIRGQIR